MQIGWKIDLILGTQPSSSIVIATGTVLMQCVGPLLNLAFLRVQPKITRIQKIQQGTKNEGKWKEARQRQTKQWFIMLNRLPEVKE